MCINDFLITNENFDFDLNEKQLQRGLQVCDIISCHAKRSFCFTKSYGKYFEGTGSLLRTISNHIRYFTPKEIANLHCFPLNYNFPQQITNRQAYSLLGNSLNVFVIGVLLENLFERT
jgi:tRNA (cytosine38-C5)-methyltransferase